MNYNLKIEMERINGNVVTQIEVSGLGRAARKRIVSPDFDQALKDLKAEHDVLVASVSDYHKPVEAAPKAVAADAKTADKPVKAAKAKKEAAPKAGRRRASKTKD